MVSFLQANRFRIDAGRFVVLLAILMLLPASVSAATLRGQVVIGGRSGEGPRFVYLERLDGTSPLESSTFQLVQRGKLFDPPILAVPAGSQVDFPNDDLIFHNVFSLSPSGPFDLGLYRAGASKSQVFRQPGMYRVFCNIHPHMTAVILVLPTSLIVEVDLDGRFQVEAVSGRYRITAWSERSEPSSVEVEVGAGDQEVRGLSLDESRFVALPHLNKHGQSYRTRAYSPLGLGGRP